MFRGPRPPSFLGVLILGVEETSLGPKMLIQQGPHPGGLGVIKAEEGVLQLRDKGL